MTGFMFAAGLLVGGFVGSLVVALAAAAKRGDEQVDALTRGFVLRATTEEEGHRE